MYPATWHTLYGDKTGESARRILPPLIELFGAKSIVEVGCGNGHWTRAAVDAGASDYLAVDGPWNNPDELLIDVGKFKVADLAQPLALDRHFDLGICLEVAEHVRGDSSAVLVKSLIDMSDVILFGAAIPHQGGYGHINEQWPSYWRDLFARQGYEAYDLIRPKHWDDEAIHYWYRQNTFVYVSRENDKMSAIAAAAQTAGSISMFDAVHPEKFELMAGYGAINFKLLARRFPKVLTKRIANKLRGLK